MPYEPLDMSRLSRELSPLSALSSLILAPYEHRRRSGDQRLSFKRHKSHRLIKYYLVHGLCSHSLVNLGSSAVIVQYPLLTAYINTNFINLIIATIVAIKLFNSLTG